MQCIFNYNLLYNGQSCEKNKIVTIKLNGIGGKQDKEKRE